VFAVEDALGDAPVRPGRVVVHLVSGQHGAQMRLTQNGCSLCRTWRRALLDRPGAWLARPLGDGVGPERQPKRLVISCAISSGASS
jgi:hypothetical protein